MLDKIKSQQSTLYKLLYLVGAMSLCKSATSCSVVESVADSDLLKCEMDDLTIKYDTSRKAVSITNTADSGTEPYSIGMLFRQYMYYQHPSSYTSARSITIDGNLPSYDVIGPYGPTETVIAPYRDRELWISANRTLLLYYLVQIFESEYSTRNYQNSTLESPNDSVEITQFKAARKESCGVQKVIYGDISANVVGNIHNTKSWAISLATSSSAMFYKFPANCTDNPSEAPTTEVASRYR